MSHRRILAALLAILVATACVVGSTTNARTPPAQPLRVAAP